MKKKKPAASRTLGCLFWAALVVVVAAVALAVREPVLRNVRNVFGLPARERSSDAGPSSAAPSAAKPSTAAPASAEPAATPSAAKPSTAAPASAEPAATPSAAKPSTAAPSAAAPAAEPSAAAPSAAKPSTAAPAADSTPRPSRTRAARLWFVKVDAEGAIELAPVSRSLAVGDSPLRDNLESLLAGPTAAETAAGFVSLIPAGSAVRSVTVKGDLATIDFSEQFRFNALGIEGLRAQLRQVVWAATEFPTVGMVQVLVEGKRVDYLAPEGAAVGAPLGRSSEFQ